MAIRPGMIMETMAVNPTAAVGGTADHLMTQPPLAVIRPIEKTYTISTTNYTQIDPHRQQDYSVRDQSVPHVHSVVHHFSIHLGILQNQYRMFSILLT